MGVIQRQGSKHSIIQILGVGIGVISTFFIYPLDTNLYGFAQFLASTAMLMMPIANLGIHSLVVKFYPRFKDSNSSAHQFFNFLLLTFTGIFTLFFSVLYWSKDAIITWLAARDFSHVDILQEYYVVLLLAIFLSTLVFIGRQQSMNYRRIVWPSVISELSFKIFLPVAIVLSVLGLLSVTEYSYLYLIYLALTVLALGFYLFRIGAWKPTWSMPTVWSKVSWRELRNYSLFSSLSKMGIMLIFKLDAFMITLMLGASSNGIFFIFLFIASVIHIPFKSINLISSPIISQAWERGNFQELDQVYKKASLNLTIISFGLFLLIWAMLPTVIPFMPNSEKLLIGLSFFLYLGLAKVTDAITSVNEQILVYSPIYYVHVFMIVAVGLLNVGLNYYLIGEMGLAGVALASLISFVVYNTAKMILIYWKFDLHPFSNAWLKAVLLVAVTWTLLWFVRDYNGLIVRILLIGASLLICYVIPLIRWNISSDFNDLLSKYIPLDFLGKTKK